MLCVIRDDALKALESSQLLGGKVILDFHLLSQTRQGRRSSQDTVKAQVYKTRKD